MNSLYLFIVVILFAFAISDLIVGVSNDAVNFLNSANGSKAAPFRIIMIVAAVGIIVGATFSNGMMEVARKGIFHPDQFYFSEIRIIFSFEYDRALKYFGAIWGGIAVTAITYFILIKGAKGSSFITPETLSWIKEHTVEILFLSLAGWSIIFQLAKEISDIFYPDRLKT